MAILVLPRLTQDSVKPLPAGAATVCTSPETVKQQRNSERSFHHGLVTSCHSIAPPLFTPERCQRTKSRTHTNNLSASTCPSCAALFGKPHPGEDVHARVHPDGTVLLMPGEACRQ